MSAIVLIGSVTLLLEEETLRRIVRPLVAFAAGALLGGASLHMLRAAAHEVAQELGDFGVLVHGG